LISIKSTKYFKRSQNQECKLRRKQKKEKKKKRIHWTVPGSLGFGAAGGERGQSRGRQRGQTRVLPNCKFQLRPG